MIVVGAPSSVAEVNPTAKKRGNERLGSGESGVGKYVEVMIHVATLGGRRRLCIQSEHECALKRLLIKARTRTRRGR